MTDPAKRRMPELPPPVEHGPDAWPRSGLLTRGQAAEFLGISLRQFTRIQKTIPHVQIGSRRVKYLERDLLAWAEKRRTLESPGRSTRSQTRATGTSSSATPDNDTVSPQAAQILQRLRQKRHASTPRLYPVDGGKS